MSSQTDLDQGGTFRQMTRVYGGPSVGWLYMANQAVLPIVAPGTYPLARGMNFVTVAANGAVTINLPSSIASLAGPQAIPGQWLINQVVIIDIGGFASANPISIAPFGTELISGTYTNASPLKLSVNYGGFILNPNLTAPGGWGLSSS
jgi:hypothetical protein